MKVAFIKKGQIVKLYLSTDVWSIAQANFRKDWQAIIEVPDNAQDTWIYNESTKELTPP